MTAATLMGLIDLVFLRLRAGTFIEACRGGFSLGGHGRISPPSGGTFIEAIRAQIVQHRRHDLSTFEWRCCGRHRACVMYTLGA